MASLEDDLVTLCTKRKDEDPSLATLVLRCIDTKRHIENRDETLEMPSLEDIQNQYLVKLPKHVREGVMNRSRIRESVRARQKIWLKQYNVGYTLSEIARFWGYDHTSILHAINSKYIRPPK